MLSVGVRVRHLCWMADDAYPCCCPSSSSSSQVGSGLVNHGGVLDYPVLPPAALPCHVPPPANLRGGTGVFLPRIEAYRYAAAPPATAKGGAATKPWAGTGSRPATGKKQERQQAEQAAPAAKHPQKQRQQQQQATGAALALPQDWCYR